MENCSECTSGTVCTKCTDNYLHPITTNCSIDCPNSYHPNSLTHTCDKCNETFFIECSLCSNLTCYGCSGGLFLATDNTSCVENCTLVESSSKKYF